jgi:hypothetical protein
VWPINVFLLKDEACLVAYSTFSPTSGVPLVPADEPTGQSAVGASATNPQSTGRSP